MPLKFSWQAARGAFDLNQRTLIQGDFFEVQFNLLSSAPISGSNLLGFVETDWGSLSCPVPISVYATSGPQPQPSGKLSVRVAPEYLPVGRVISFTVAATDEGSGTPVAGTAFIRNYVPVVQASYTFEVPTNTEVRRI